MKLVYNGAHAEVFLAETEQDIERGVATEIPDELAKRLLEQSTWSEPPKAAHKPSSKS